MIGSYNGLEYLEKYHSRECAMDTELRRLRRAIIEYVDDLGAMDNAQLDRTTIMNDLLDLRSRRHVHRAGIINADECRLCKRDFRHPTHMTVGEQMAEFAGG